MAFFILVRIGLCIKMKVVQFVDNTKTVQTEFENLKTGLKLSESSNKPLEQLLESSEYTCTKTMR